MLEQTSGRDKNWYLLSNPRTEIFDYKNNSPLYVYSTLRTYLPTMDGRTPLKGDK